MRLKLLRESSVSVPDVICDDRRPRVPPGEYLARVRVVKGPYRDRFTGRWTLLLVFDVMKENLFEIVAKNVPMFFNLGYGEKPKASRGSKYFHAWCVANGGPPRRGDRMTTRVFANRLARVLLDDTKRSRWDLNRAVAPYSVVRKILRWETGLSTQEFNSSTVQGRHRTTATAAMGCGEALSKEKPSISGNGRLKGSARAGVESQDNTTQGAGGEKYPVRQRQHTARVELKQVAARLRAKFSAGQA